MTKNYRKIYEQYNGKIPVDSDGRKYDIHHIDGNHENNDPKNLVAVTIQEHYDIHFNQRDWAACLIIAARMEIDPKTKSELAKKSNKKRIEDGSHPFVGDTNPSKLASKNKTHPSQRPEMIELRKQQQNEKVKNGTHIFVTNNPVHERVLDGTHGISSKQNTIKRIQDGTHNFLGDTNPVYKRVEEGTHNFLGDANPVHRLVSEGVHNLQGDSGSQLQKRLLAEGNHPTQVKLTCPHCGLIGAKPVMSRFHMDKCKSKS